MMGFFFAAMLMAAPIFAQTINDSDLGGPGRSAFSNKRLLAEARGEARRLVFALGFEPSARTRAAAGTVTGALMLTGRAGNELPGRLGKVKLVGPGAAADWTPVDDNGKFSIALPDGLSGTFHVRVSLDNKFWAYHNPSSDAGYEWETPAVTLKAGAGADVGTVRPEPGSENAKLAVLHLAYLDALDFLKRDADIDWWDKPLTINWPGSADFFSPWAWSLDLTDATHWDVVLHELGHAVQAGSMSARSAGGAHKIDECYGPELAWSEGWASFFAAAVALDHGDSDAKFQFMVPRRAPIRVENVPDDVCRGESSEWRVFAGLWDLIDTHDDGLDHFAMPFHQLWRSLRGQSMGSMTEAWALIAKDLDLVSRRAAEDALIQNTILPPRAPLSVRLPARSLQFDGR